MSRPRSPSERQRAAWALAGVYVPAEGQKGHWQDPSWRSSGTKGMHAARIVVTRVSPSGKTLWVRFLGEHPFDRELEYPYERGSDDSDGSYYSGGSRSPYGELKFLPARLT